MTPRFVFVACVAADDFFQMAASACVSFHASYVVCFVTRVAHAFAFHDAFAACGFVASRAALFAGSEASDNAVFDVKDDFFTQRAQPFVDFDIVDEIWCVFDEGRVRV